MEPGGQPISENGSEVRCESMKDSHHPDSSSNLKSMVRKVKTDHTYASNYGVTRDNCEMNSTSASIPCQSASKFSDTDSAAADKFDLQVNNYTEFNFNSELANDVNQICQSNLSIDNSNGLNKREGVMFDNTNVPTRSSDTSHAGLNLTQNLDQPGNRHFTKLEQENKLESLSSHMSNIYNVNDLQKYSKGSVTNHESSLTKWHKTAYPCTDNSLLAFKTDSKNSEIRVSKSHDKKCELAETTATRNGLKNEVEEIAAKPSQELNYLRALPKCSSVTKCVPPSTGKFDSKRPEYRLATADTDHKRVEILLFPKSSANNTNEYNSDQRLSDKNLVLKNNSQATNDNRVKAELFSCRKGKIEISEAVTCNKKLTPECQFDKSNSSTTLLSKVNFEPEDSKIKTSNRAQNFIVSKVLESGVSIRTPDNIIYAPKQERDQKDELLSFKDKGSTIQKTQAHTCDKCGATFSKAASLLRHDRLHGIDEVLWNVCKKCGALFNNGLALSLHRKVHMSTYRANWLSLRFKFYPGVQPFTCEDCGALFVTKKALEHHSVVHGTEIWFSCPDCNRVFIHFEIASIHCHLVHGTRLVTEHVFSNQRAD